VPQFAGNVMRMLSVHSIEDFRAMPIEPKYKIRQPSLEDQNRQDAMLSGKYLLLIHSITTFSGGLDLILMPGVAFDAHCRRLGHGKGYYDSYIHALKKAFPDVRVSTLALSLNEQVVNEVPVHEHDVIVDQVVSEQGL
jgi:5-formyltetrahydrofolate cyclo-ligase